MPPGEQLAPFTTSTRHYNGNFLNKRKQNIYCYYWKPVAPRALLLISHGFTEHCMMYDALANEMARRGFFVFAHDHEPDKTTSVLKNIRIPKRHTCNDIIDAWGKSLYITAGHGHSEGTPGYVEDMYDLVEDSLIHVQMVREEFQDIPLFICGHSMGGTVSVLTSLRKEIGVSGVVLIAPAFAPNPETATFLRVTVAKLLSKLFPHFPIAPTDFSLSCQNEDKVQEMNKDPLRYHGYWKVRPVICLLQSGEEILRKSPEVTFPFLLLHGNTDKICHLSGATDFFEGAASEDKTLKIYPGGYHSLLNEPREIADDVFEETVAWLDARV